MELDEFYRQVEQSEGRSVSVPALIRKVYTWMALALAITGITAYGVASNPHFIELVFGSRLTFYGLIGAELALVLILSARINKLSLLTGTLMFIAYSVLNGITMSAIFLAYTASSIASTFFICAGTFGVMSTYGLLTKTDLSSVGKMLYMALFGLIIATVVNIFLHSPMVSYITSYVGVVIFVGLTAWDTQKIKLMLADADYMDEGAQKLALLGALTLYLDFVNLFLYLLRIFGGKKD